MTEYYYLATLLPEIQLGMSLDLDFSSLVPLLQMNLNREDYEKVEALRRYFDIQNVRAFWKNEPFDPYGNHNEVELEEMLITRMGLPDYIYDFMKKYEDIGERVKHFPRVVSSFYENEQEHANGFLKKFFQFEKEWRLVFTAFRAKKLDRDLLSELQHESPNDEIVAQIIAQKDAKNYEPPYRYSDMKPIFEKNQEEPFSLHQALCEYRFAKIDEFLGIELFSIDKILAYVTKLMIAEKWLELDREKGMEVVDHIVKEAS